MNERLLVFFDPARSIILFVVGTAALTLVLQAAYDFANDPWTWQGGYLLAIVASAVAAAALLILSGRDRRRRALQLNISEQRRPEKRRGLILLASPTLSSAPAAIEYHLPIVEHLWIIATDASLSTAIAIAEQYNQQVRHIYFSAPYIVEAEEAQSVYNVATRIFTRELAERGLTTEHVVADLTGGTKPMTTGLALACLQADVSMEYVVTARDDQGRIIAGAPAEPARLDVRAMAL